jgi:hypothetical protein
MRIKLIVSLLFAGALSTAGCSVSSVEEAEETEATEEALGTSAVAKKLVGDWKAESSESNASFNLASNGKYVWNTGIVCIKAPCPTTEKGTWSLHKRSSTKFEVKINPSERGAASRWYKVTLKNDEPQRLVGINGAQGAFVRKKEIISCAVTLCEVGTRCDDGNGTHDAVCRRENPCNLIECPVPTEEQQWVCTPKNEQAECHEIKIGPCTGPAQYGWRSGLTLGMQLTKPLEGHSSFTQRPPSVVSEQMDPGAQSIDMHVGLSCGMQAAEP